MKRAWFWARVPGWALLLIVLLVAVGAASLRTAEAQGGSGEPPAFQAVKGRITFRNYCVNCHGENADGTGHLARYLNVKPTDLTTLEANHGGVFPVEIVTESIDGRRFVKGHGSRDMPIWGEVFQSPLVEATGGAIGEDRVECKLCELVYFLETIQVSPSKGTPHTSEPEGLPGRVDSR